MLNSKPFQEKFAQLAARAVCVSPFYTFLPRVFGGKQLCNFDTSQRNAKGNKVQANLSCHFLSNFICKNWNYPNFSKSGSQLEVCPQGDYQTSDTLVELKLDNDNP